MPGSAERTHQKMFVIVESDLFLEWKATTIRRGQTITERVKEWMRSDIEGLANGKRPSRRKPAAT